MVKTKKVNKNRSKLFGIVINPKLDKRMTWESLSSVEVGEKLKELKFLNKFLLTEYLNNLKVENVSKNLTGIKKRLYGSIRIRRREQNSALPVSN